MSTLSIRQTPGRRGWESHAAGIQRIRDELEPHVGPITDYQAQCFIKTEWFEIAQCCANRVADRVAGPHRDLMEAGRKQNWSRAWCHAFDIVRGLVKAHGIPPHDHDLDPLVMRAMEGIESVK